MIGLPDKQTKRCSKCGEVKPIEAFYKRSGKKGGLESWCKACKSAYHRANADLIAERMRRWRAANHEAISERARQYYVENREAHNEYGRRWRAENREAISEYGRQRYAENRESLNEYGRQYYAANREARIEYGRQYHVVNPAIGRAARLRRNARVRALPAVFTTADWQAALDTFNGCCAVCGRPPGLWHTIAADHWIPITAPDCPGTVPHNIVPLCHGVGGCNNSKLNRPAGEWLIDKFGKRKARVIQQRIETYLESTRQLA